MRPTPPLRQLNARGINPCGHRRNSCWLAGSSPLPGMERPLHCRYLRAASMIAATVANARILIVDDEPANISALGRVLTAAGYQVLATTSPLEGLRLYHEQAPEIMLLDLHMPELDGIGVIHRLKRAAPSQAFLPVLVLTGDTSPDARRRVLAAGAKDFVAKPFDMDEVLLRIRNLLETGRLYREIKNQN